MAVKLVVKFNKAQIRQLVQGRKQRVEDAILLRMQYIGEQFVINARDNANFRDRTGNLRSSIGYVILHNGKQIFDNFQAFPPGDETKKKGSKQTGVSAAKKAVAEAKKSFPSGFVLIGVAGMEYAAAVESKGYDVITASSQVAEQSLKAAIIQIQNKLGKVA